jgi:Catalase
MRTALLLGGLTALSRAACPFMDGNDAGLKDREAAHLHARDDSGSDFLNQFTLDDTNSFMTSDVGGPIMDSISLKAGDRGPTLLEDFIFRQKIQHFDHERVCFSASGGPLGLLVCSCSCADCWRSRFRNARSMLVALVSSIVISALSELNPDFCA